MKRYYIMLGTQGAIRLALYLLMEKYLTEGMAILEKISSPVGSFSESFGSILLPTGAKFALATGSRKKGKWVIYGYAHDLSDLTPFLHFGKKVLY